MQDHKDWTDQTRALDGIIVCTLERVDSAGIPWVRLPGGRVSPAKTTTSVTTKDLADAAVSSAQALVTLLSDTQEPVIIGIIAAPSSNTADSTPREPLTAEIDGERVVLTGNEQVVLRCGKASITLTKAGKILLRGSYVSSRSSGVNRIKGGSVQIN